MTADAKALSIETSAAPAPGIWAAVDRLLRWLGDRLNPILVKETRQSLKSRQFIFTFTLLLLCGWVWSIGGVALIGPDIHHRACGPTMFFGYLLILAFPLLVIVPFGAFRNMASEHEDRTYEVLSITTLRPTQIVAGKLGSAALQMIIYLSAISPCLAFTYMLRGIDLPTVAFVLVYLTAASLGLALIALLFGTLAVAKYQQSLLSVLVVLGLAWVFGTACAFAYGVLEENFIAVEEPEFWQVNGSVLTIFVSYCALVFYATAARLTFASDNRATRLRVIMLLQHSLCVGWVAWLWVMLRGDPRCLMVLLVLVGLHWYAMGTMMIGESPDMSQRVRRQLPRSWLGRVLLTWFNPGPGTGYVFAVCGLLGALAVAVLAFASDSMAANLVADWRGASTFSTGTPWAVLAFGTLGACYIIFYLGVGLLLVRLGRTISPVGIQASVLIQILLLLAGCGVPYVVQMMMPSLRNADYTLMQISNPLWTVSHLTEGCFLGGSPPPEMPVLLVVLPLAALVVFLLNLPGVVREIGRVRIALPARVAEEDAAQTPPKLPVRTSPWDE